LRKQISSNENDLAMLCGEKRTMEANQKRVKIVVDGSELTVPEGITVLEAAEKNGIHVPTLCYHSALSNWGGCRMCIVEVDGAPKLAASCVTPVRDGMEVVTTNERIIEARRTVLEFLFAERNHNCMFCPQSGDCELQKLAYELGMDHLTVSFSFNAFPTDVTNEDMVIDHNRCILCGRCVRACAELAGNYVLNFHNRGPRNLVGLDLHASREESTCYGCGVCLQVCPTGAIYNRHRTHYAVKGHSRDWKAVDSFCPQCGLLCPTVSRVHENTIIKIEGKLGQNGRPDRGQLCARGRFEALKSEGKRLLRPMVKGTDGSWKEESLSEALALVASNLKTIQRRHGGNALFGLISGAASNEELLFFRDMMTKGFSAGSVASLDADRLMAVSLAERKGSGDGMKEASWVTIPEADFIALLGADLRQTQPMLSSLIRKGIIERGVKVAVIGEMDGMPPFAAFHLPAEIKEIPHVVKAFRLEVTERMKKSFKKGKTVTRGAKGEVQGLLKNAGLSKDEKQTFYDIAEAFTQSVKPLLIVGEGITGLKSPSAFQDAAKLARSKGTDSGDGVRLMILKPSGNSAAARKLGLCENGKSVMGRGGIAVLGHARDLESSALAGLGEPDFLAVISPYFPESLAGKAHVVIPKPLWMEENGSFTSLDGTDVVHNPRIIDPPEGVTNSWEILNALAEQAGFRHTFVTCDDLSMKAEKAIKGRGKKR
jgi:formate dehydrogenase major subunit